MACWGGTGWRDGSRGAHPSEGLGELEDAQDTRQSHYAKDGEDLQVGLRGGHYEHDVDVKRHDSDHVNPVCEREHKRPEAHCGGRAEHASDELDGEDPDAKGIHHEEVYWTTRFERLQALGADACASLVR